jgi:predicted secreted acid phosphatase
LGEATLSPTSEEHVKLPFPLTGRTARTTTVAIASAAATAALTIPGLAIAHGGHGGHDGAVPAPPAAPTSDSQIQNIDQVKTAIKAYYGDTPTTVADPVNGATTLHQFSPTGAYAQQTEGIAGKAEHYLAKRAHHGHWKVQVTHAKHQHHAAPAILFDIDDTTLNTYSYEIYSSFVYNPTTNAAFVNAGSKSVFPAVPGMVDLEQKALAEGYTVFFLTGRPSVTGNDQKPATLANLRAAGYTVNDDQVYLKDASGATEPWLSTCAPTCTTTQYKSLTREHIESLGYDIAANFGDQFSDLNGGFADKVVKMPNPMYFLP